ncbi:MmcQ/YjbR family DNA-binding protein [Hymenobacter sp. DG25A]|uniref:MmcQ/YjbR family DNA-binding protein n=1 Tax=Hymenobacter sp. DG25A TaxID=1385663 RepID=UPI0006BCE0E4|nr:MmcQ/YjbR family DNA-binding protein [Hymenobacter sp. DG25A]ALD21650.1 hypothetical protein AM218_11080 [Hymenobacter sp. DG25A]
MNLEDLRSFCQHLPAATEDIKWGHDLCFSVGQKMFCVMSLDSPTTVSFKASDEDFALLTETPAIIPAPYMARHHWMLVQELRRFTTPEWQEYVRKSYELVWAKLSRRVQQELSARSSA